MASKLPDDPPCNTQETDEDTVAFRKKRLRRVSFADREITSVHIFKRDEDYETPPYSTPRQAPDREKEVYDLFRDLLDGDGDDGEDDGLLSAGKPFLKPMQSPSPGGSSTAGSAISNDEDNFFGPVSANFIRPGRLSDSAASDDNHDITMDSTAFSMHFRSLVRSESGDLTTSTERRLASEEETPMPSDPESLMVLTKVKKLKSPSPVPINTFSGGRDSNDMSLVGESLHKYDYGRLSPRLEALLAEGSEEINAIPASDSASPKLSRSELAISHDNGSDMSGKDISVSQNDLVETAGDSTATLIEQNMLDCSANPRDGPISEVMSGTTELNSEFPAVTNGTPVNQNGEAALVDLSNQFEFGNQPPAKDGLKENSSQDEMHAYNAGVASNQAHESPLAGSIHSISAKKRKILLDTTNSTRPVLLLNPSPKESSSILSKGSFKQGGSVPSILNSSSKLKNLEPFPCGSAFNDSIVKSKFRLSASLSSRASPFNKTMEEGSASLHSQQANAIICNLEGKFSSVDLKKGEVDCNGLDTPKNISTLTQDRDITGLRKDKEYNDESTERMATITSSSKVTHLGKKVMTHSLSSADSVDRTLVASTVDSSPAKITLGINKDQRDTAILYKPVSPVVNVLNQKFLSSPTDYQGSLSCNLKLQDEDRQECRLGEAVPCSHSLTPVAENRTDSSSAPVKINSLIDPSTIRTVDERDSNGLDLQNPSETLRNFPNGIALKLLAGSPKNIHTSTEPTKFSGDSVVEQTEGSSAYGSLDAQRSKNNQSPRKSPKDVVSLNCSSIVQRTDDCHQGFAQNQSPVQDIQNSSKRKRTSEEEATKDEHYADKCNSIQQRPKFHKVGENYMERMLEYSNGCEEGNGRLEGGKTLMNLTDIYLKLSADTNQPVSPCFDKLNIKVINMLADILLHQKKVNICEMLCSEIELQLCSAYDQSSNIRRKRVTESRPLLYRIIYEKTKLQLMHVKHENLMKKVQLLRTRVQDSQILKLNCAQHLCISAEKDRQLDDSSCCPVRVGGNVEGTSDKVTTMRHEAEVLEKKITNLTKSLHIYCKMKGEPSCFETIELAKNHLKKRTCCRSVRQDMQLWEVDDLQKRNGHHNVVLNYHGFISQSLKLNRGPVSSIIVLNKLNDTNITKNFPNMDACSAFEFVFKHESTRKYVGPKSLAQVTQRMSSLLRNLLDVVEEVQIARLEISNLTQTSFHSPSAEQLLLQLTFIDFNSGRKVMVTLDMTCLNCGVYPSEILPSHLETPTAGTEKLQLHQLPAEINTAVSNLRAGYLRIIRLCRCVSQVMRSSGR